MSAPENSGRALYGQLLGILTEGSRTQLARIQESTQELQQSAGPAQQQALERVRVSVWELASLIGDVADLYGYATGRFDERDSAFDLRVTLEGLRTRLSRALPRGEWMGLSRIRHEVPPLLEGKPSRLQDILLGVTTSLATVWPEGTLRVDVAKGWERTRDIELVFHCEVRPSTPPEPEHVEWFRATLAGATEPEVLSRRDLRIQLAKRLTAACGGSLQACAGDPGVLAFELRLPFGMRPLPETAPSARPPLKLRGRRALVCDSSAERRERLTATLRLWGLEAEACGRAGDVAEALRAAGAAGRPFDFALVDADLEGAEGVAIGRAIRSDLRNRGIHLVVLYGIGLRGDAKLAEEAGFEAYLPREISVHELREALGMLLKRTAVDAAAGILTQHTLADVRLEGIRILLATRDAMGALVVTAVLRRKGFGVDRVERIEEGAERCAKTRYDFIILDVADMSADEKSQACGLRAISDQQDPTPIAVLVDRAGSDEIRELEALAPDAVFAKPVDLEQICTFCEGFLYPELAPPTPRASTDAIVFVVSSTADVEATAVFEPGRLDESTMGIQGLQVTVVESFLDQMPRRVEAIAAAVTAGELGNAEQEVLSARALALTIGAYATARCLDLLGDQIRERRVDEALAAVGRLRIETEKSLEVLRAAHATLREAHPTPHDEKRAA